jgi:glycosyltransferase involved in cell wall biosynthesis
MRIWSILAQSPPFVALGGAEIQMHSLHKGLMQRGVEVHVIANVNNVKKRFQIYDGLPIWGVSFPRGGIKGMLFMHLSWLATKKIAVTEIPRPDLIHATMFREPAILANKLACLFNVPWTVRMAGSGNNGDFHYSKQRWFIRKQIPLLTKSVAGVIALDEFTYSEAYATGISPDRIEIIQNGVSLSRSRLMDYKSGDRASKPFTIVYAGRLAEQKRVDTLLRAVKIISDRYPVAILRLIVAGDGPDKERLLRIAQRLGIESWCQFTGHLESIEELLQEADCFVNPSESEGLPNAVLEALYCGVPVILSDIPVHRKLSTDVGIDRFCFQVGDHCGLSNALLNFSELCSSEKNSISATCYQYGEQFSSFNRDEHYMSFFSRIVNCS